jgi:hypothetical protein
VAHGSIGFDSCDPLIELPECLVSEVPLDVGGYAELVLGPKLKVVRN